MQAFIGQETLSKIPIPLGSIAGGFALFINPILLPVYAVLILSLAIWFKKRSPWGLGKNNKGKATWLRSFTTALLIVMAIVVSIGATIFPLFLTPKRTDWAIGMMAIMFTFILMVYLLYRSFYLCQTSCPAPKCAKCPSAKCPEAKCPVCPTCAVSK